MATFRQWIVVIIAVSLTGLTNTQNIETATTPTTPTTSITTTSAAKEDRDHLKFQAVSKDATGTIVPLYYQGGSTRLHCHSSNSSNTSITFGGKKNGAFKDVKSGTLDVPIGNRTGFGTYHCKQADAHFDLNLSISYTLCNPLYVNPVMVCRNRTLCLLKNFVPTCQTSFDCGNQATERLACWRTKESSANETGLCRLYSKLKELPPWYYIGTTDACKSDVRFYNGGAELEFGTTIAVTTMRNLSMSGSHNLSYTCTFRCEARVFKGVWYIFQSKPTGAGVKTDITLRSQSALRDNLPAKATMKCSVMSGTYEEDEEGTMYFYLLFYERKSLRMTITQGSKSLNVTTKDIGQEALNPALPFNCTVSYAGGFRIGLACFSGNASNSSQQLDENSVELQYWKDAKGIYPCIASIHYYEVPPNSRYKLLFEERREIVIKFKHETGGLSPTRLYTLAGLLVVGLIIILVVIVVVIVIFIRKRTRTAPLVRMSGKDAEHLLTRTLLESLDIEKVEGQLRGITEDKEVVNLLDSPDLFIRQLGNQWRHLQAVQETVSQPENHTFIRTAMMPRLPANRKTLLKLPGVKWQYRRGGTQGQMLNRNMTMHNSEIPNIWLKKHFLAMQTPCKEEMRSFLRYVIAYKVNLIICLHEQGFHHRIPLFRYYDMVLNQSLNYDNIIITCTATIRNSDDVKVMRWSITDIEQRAQHTVVFVHYKSWQERSKLDDSKHLSAIESLIRERVVGGIPSQSVRTLIHCTDGVGRTGSLIVYLLATECIREYPEAVNLVAIVNFVRSKRPGSVQTLVEFLMVACAVARFVGHYKRNEKKAPEYGIVQTMAISDATSQTITSKAVAVTTPTKQLQFAKVCDSMLIIEKQLQAA